MSAFGGAYRLGAGGGGGGECTCPGAPPPPTRLGRYQIRYFKGDVQYKWDFIRRLSFKDASQDWVRDNYPDQVHVQYCNLRGLSGGPHRTRGKVPDQVHVPVLTWSKEHHQHSVGWLRGDVKVFICQDGDVIAPFRDQSWLGRGAGTGRTETTTRCANKAQTDRRNTNTHTHTHTRTKHNN